MPDFAQAFRPSDNIEDRRGELQNKNLNDLFDLLFPGPQAETPLPPLVPGAEQNPLAQRAGINDIEKSLALAIMPMKPMPKPARLGDHVFSFPE
jgi:hypothetical protein